MDLNTFGRHVYEMIYYCTVCDVYWCYNIKIKYTPAVRSEISSELIFASCV